MSLSLVGCHSAERAKPSGQGSVERAKPSGQVSAERREPGRRVPRSDDWRQRQQLAMQAYLGERRGAGARRRASLRKRPSGGGGGATASAAQEEAIGPYDPGRLGLREPLSDAALDAKIQAAFARESASPSGRALAEAIRDALGLSGMLARLEVRLPRIEILREARGEEWIERDLVLHDRFVGRIEALLLLPLAARQGRGQAPPLRGEGRGQATPSASSGGVLALHGHGSSPARFARERLGFELARRGHTVILPRAPVCGAADYKRSEPRVARALLRRGLPLMGLRVYEGLVALAVLRATPGVDPARLAVIGHSGGSSAGNLLVRLADVRAQVTDYQIPYRHADGSRLGCESVPALTYLSDAIHDEATLGPARLVVPYDSPRREGIPERILAFLDRRLKPGR